jgi:hypothetical protein
MANAQSEYAAWWVEVRAVLQAARLALGALDTTDVAKKLQSGGPGLRGLVSVALKNPERCPELALPVPAGTPTMALPEIQKKAIDLAAMQYPKIMARLKAGGFSPLPPPVAPSPSGPVPPSTWVADPQLPWPAPGTPPPPSPKKEPNPETIRKRQRKALHLRFSPPIEQTKGTLPSQEQDPWSASLELEAHEHGWALVLLVEPLLGLPDFCKTLQLTSDSPPNKLLGSNLRSGVSRIPVVPSSKPYRFDSPGFEEELADLLAPLEQPGFSTERATLFRVHAQGRATRSSGTTVPPGSSVLVLVPPGLSGVVLPEGGASLSGGFRLLPLRLELPLTPGQPALLAALGLQAGESGLEVRWAGAGATRYTSGHDGTTYPCFSGSPVVALERSGVAQKLWLLLTSENDEAELRLDAETGGAWVTLGDLPAGSYALDILGETPEIGERLFFAVGQAAPLPAARVTAEPGGGEPLVLGHPPAELEVDLKALRLAFNAPPGWEFFVRWSGRRHRVLGGLAADAQGRIEEESVRTLLATVGRERAGDVEISAGELGSLVLCHEAEVDGEATAEAIAHLVHERWSSLDAIARDASLLKTILVAPVVELLGYEIDAGSLVAAEGVGWHLSRVFRDGKAIVTRREELLVLLPPGVLQPANAINQEQRRVWQELLRQHQLRRALITDGRCWLVLERAQRWMFPPVDLSGTGVLGIRGPVDLLLRAVQP